MSRIDILGSPVEDSAVPDPAPQHACRVPEYVEDDLAPAPHRRPRRLIVLVLVAALLIGGVGGWFGSRITADHPVTTSKAAPLPAGIAGYAELYVAGHLVNRPTADEAGQPPSVWINQSAAITGEQVDEQSWLVTVAVDSLELVDSVYQPAELQYFNLLVTSVGGQPTSLGLPSRVPVTAPADQSASLFSQPVPDDQAVAAISFIQEYLTGGNDLSRYLAIPSRINAFQSAPYAQVAAVPVGTNSLGMIRVAVTATKSNGVVHRLEYVVTMEVRGGAWVVADITPAAR